MAFWPFGRKSKKNKAHDQNMAPTRNKTTQTLLRDNRSDPIEPVVPTLSRKPSRKESQKRLRSSSRKLTKRRDSERVEPPLPSGPMVDRRDLLNERILPGATSRSVQQLSKAPADRGDVPSYYFQHQMSTTSLQPENFSAIPKGPTLSSKRSANDGILPRRKSSKRKADDHAREQEIKAMSSPIPIPKRPASHASGLLSRDSRRVPGGINRNLERPTSDVSIPIAESLTSSVSVIPESVSFRVSAIDALSPRPTIRYSENPRLAGGSGSLRPSRTSTRKEKQPIIPEEVINPKKRIDDLANDMDAGSLRELMERDRRRTEKNRKSDRDQLQRSLQRKADKQRAQESADEPNAAMDVVDMHSAAEKQARSPGATAEHDDSWLKDPEKEPRSRTPESWLHDLSRENFVPNSPFRDPVAGTEKSHLEAPSPTDDPEDPVLETAKAVRLSQASMSPPTSPKQHAHEPSTLSHFAYLASRSTPDIPERPEDQRRDSDTSTRLSSNWKSIFRRSNTRGKRRSIDRGRTTPSEFSNTSRESFARQMPPSAFTRIPRARSGTPIRTQSRFREDLPELPLSPPDSRMQSPEVAAQRPSPQPDQARSSITSNPSQPLSDIHPAFREEIALSRHQSLNKGSPEARPSMLMSQSLASVDSEGSWLTGRPVKRSSQNPVNPLRESASSLQSHLRDLGASGEDIRSAEKEVEHEAMLTPGPEEVFSRQLSMRRVQPREDSGIAGDSEEDIALHPAPAPIAEEGTWHGAVGKQPTIIRQNARARSREGLLNEYNAEEESAESSPIGDSPGGNTSSPDTPFIQRATSVDFGKSHARHISAGSARLLNLPARSSGEMKRMSSASGERSPLGTPSPRQPNENQVSDVD
ncbi:MAG: hypothetical protein L6R40_007933 [Gallowayella cf. fulva]|nr:MAG: hypothetical protein L6R40_007933 [Xanthomendoza cf. fulva]